ncbi:MAG TPA: cytochrome b562 [Chthoniobacteraceae bacterium]|jgi:hypothetical protein
MKIKALLTLAVTLMLGVHFAAAADEKEDTPLSKEMAQMNKSLRLLKRQVADPTKKEANLELLAKIRKNTKASHDYEPAKGKDVPAGEKTAYMEKYKQQLTELDKTFEQLETALKADNQDEAKKIFEKLTEQKEQGHKDFAPDSE